jgi:hypothetical protein
LSSLILLPSAVDRGKTFYITNVAAYLKIGLARGHIDPVLIAASCLHGIKQRGCTEISIGLEGMLPRTYTVQALEEQIRKHPAKFRGWVRPLPPTNVARHRERMISRFHLPSL